MAIADQNSKSLGTTLETWLIDWYDSLERVPDRVAEWYDCETTAAMWPTGVTPFVGVCVVEKGSPVEIKTCARERSNGPDRESAGHWYIKQQSHRRLLDAGGHYLLAVHNGPDAILARRMVPAAVLDPILDGRWYRTGRSHGPVAQLSWPRVVDSL